MTVDFILDPDETLDGNLLRSICDCSSGVTTKFYWRFHIKICFFLVIVLAFLCFLLKRRTIFTLGKQRQPPKRSVMIWLRNILPYFVPLKEIYKHSFLFILLALARFICPRSQIYYKFFIPYRKLYRLAIWCSAWVRYTGLIFFSFYQKKSWALFIE